MLGKKKTKEERQGKPECMYEYVRMYGEHLSSSVSDVSINLCLIYLSIFIYLSVCLPICLYLSIYLTTKNTQYSGCQGRFTGSQHRRCSRYRFTVGDAISASQVPGCVTYRLKLAECLLPPQLSLGFPESFCRPAARARPRRDQEGEEETILLLRLLSCEGGR